MVTLGDSVRKTIDELAKIAYYRHLLTALLSCSVVSFGFYVKKLWRTRHTLFSLFRGLR